MPENYPTPKTPVECGLELLIEAEDMIQQAESTPISNALLKIIEAVKWMNTHA